MSERSKREQALLVAARAEHDPVCDACRRDAYKYVMSCSRFQQTIFTQVVPLVAQEQAVSGETRDNDGCSEPWCERNREPGQGGALAHDPLHGPAVEAPC